MNYIADIVAWIQQEKQKFLENLIRQKVPSLFMVTKHEKEDVPTNILSKH